MKRLVSIILGIAIVFSTVGVCYAMDLTTLKSDSESKEPSKQKDSESISINLKNQCNTEQSKIVGALGQYSIVRETEFLSGKAVLQQPELTFQNLDRNRFIEEWTDELNIDIVWENAEYSVEEVLQETETNIKLLVYEWVWLDYVCDGYDEVETMGFGTNHILNFAKANGELQLISDSYSEITGYEEGTAEELAMLHNKIEMDTSSMYSDEEWNEASLLAGTGYNASAAISYSETWCGNSNPGTSVSMKPSNYNPSYYYYSGADCCNFVSQCLKAGGMTMSGTWTATLNTSGTPTNDSNYSKSGSAWRYVPDFVTFWTGKGCKVTRITSSNQAVSGNPIYYLKSDGYASNHIMLIVGKNSAGQVLINGHNNDAYRYPLTLSSKIYYTLDLVNHSHNYSIVYSKNAATHTLKCSICGQTKVEPHIFESIASLEHIHAEDSINYVQRCAICGYTK